MLIMYEPFYKYMADLYEAALEINWAMCESFWRLAKA
jgi:hypothetical protein